MVRLRFNFLIILILIFSYAIEKLEIFRPEVVNLTQFTDYYTIDGEGVNGEQILSSIYFTVSREYDVVLQPIKPEEEKKPEIPKKEATFSTYTVKSGDTVSTIAKKFGLRDEIVRANNPNLGKVLRVGDKLTIPSENGIKYKVLKGDSLFKIARKFKVKEEIIKEYSGLNNSTIRPGQELFIKDPDLKFATPVVASKPTISSVIKKPITSIKNATTSIKNSTTKKPTTTIPTKTTTSSSGGFVMPVKYAGVASSFGVRLHPILKRYISHNGVDLKARYVTLKAAKAGTVIYTGYQSGYGKIIKISHSDGFETRYAHLDQISVNTGDKVTTGQVIGKTGNTGRSTGPHLHLEMLKNGKFVNPMSYIK